MSGKTHVFISPHLDDAVLSCGGTIYRLAKSGEQVIILTIFTADVGEGEDLSRENQWRLMVWRLDKNPYQARCQEDAAAAGVLGARYLHLGLHDAMYRTDAQHLPLYQKQSTHIPVHPDDWAALEPQVREKIRQTLDGCGGAGVCIYCPLGIGGHVDHLITRFSVEQLFAAGDIVYYEDFPYVARAKEKPELKPGTWQSLTQHLLPDEINARIDASSCYKSQITILFPTRLQRWQNRILFYAPAIGKLLYWLSDAKSSQNMMAQLTQTYIAANNGERFWRQSPRPL